MTSISADTQLQTHPQNEKIKISLGLVHGPVKNKWGKVVTTSVTNLDVHDISRTCRTFGFEKFYIITPVWAQHELLGRMLGYWGSSDAKNYNHDRHDALSLVTVINSISDAINHLRGANSEEVRVAVTGANFQMETSTVIQVITDLKERVEAHLGNQKLLLLLGTGHGLLPETVDEAHYRLKPIWGRAHDGYNHLSVRSAAAIYGEKFSEGMKNIL